jgi:hypothetical protein
MAVEIFGLLLAVARSIRRQADALRCFVLTTSDGPTFLERTNRNCVPEVGVLGFVVGVEVTDVKSTDVAQDLVDAFIAPVVG